MSISQISLDSIVMKEPVMLSKKSNRLLEILKDMLHIKYLLVMDFEATCDGSDDYKNEIIEFPCFALKIPPKEDIPEDHDVNNYIIDKFSAFVKPTEIPILSEFCRDLTTISQTDVDSAKTISEVFKDFTAFYTNLMTKYTVQPNEILIATCGDWDLNRCLKHEFKRKGIEIPIWCKYWCNIKYLFQQIGLMDARETHTMMESLNMTFIGQQHRGVVDSFNYVRMVIELIRRGAVINATTISHDLVSDHNIRANHMLTASRNSL